MKVFNDYDFLAKYVRPSLMASVHLELAASVANEVKVRSVLDIGGGSSSYLHLLKPGCYAAVVDVSEESLKKVIAGKKMVGALPKLNITERYEFVSVLEVLEHLAPDSYEESLSEISRVSSRYVFVTSPFLQDLYAAHVLCDKCGAEFQCEGHCRFFDLKTIFGLQTYFGGLKDVYFFGPSQGRYASFKFKTSLKKVVRRIVQKLARIKYCKPPFTKCPDCGHEIFNHYEDYISLGNLEESDQRWWRWDGSGVVSGRFGALYSKEKDIANLKP